MRTPRDFDFCVLSFKFIICGRLQVRPADKTTRFSHTWSGMHERRFASLKSEYFPMSHLLGRLLEVLEHSLNFPSSKFGSGFLREGLVIVTNKPPVGAQID